MHRRAALAVILAACVVAACNGQAPCPAAPHPGSGSRNCLGGSPPEEKDASASEKLAVRSKSGWRPLAGTSLTGTPLTELQTPSYAAPLLADKFPSSESAAEVTRRPGGDRAGAGGGTGASTRTPRHEQPPPSVHPGPGQRITPIYEHDGREDAVGYRYPHPLGFGPGPSSSAPFWEVAWLRRRERLLHDLGLQGPCGCGYPLGYPAGPPIGYLAPYRLDGLADPDLPYRLGVGAYGLYGGRPLHHHNTAPPPRLHDNPN